MNRNAATASYELTRTRAGVCRIVVAYLEDGKTRHRHLGLRLNLRNHSPTGFEWGYGGSGPAQAALAILADFYDDRQAVAVYQTFKGQVIARVPRQGRIITGTEIELWRQSLSITAVRDAAQKAGLRLGGAE